MIIKQTLTKAPRLIMVAGLAGLASIWGAPLTPSLAQETQPGPASVADIAEGLLEAVVNVSTAQSVSPGQQQQRPSPMPDLPEDSPFQDFFEEFFGGPGGEGQAPSQRMQSLGSGFIIDAEEGIVITNNHVVADADEIEINFADGDSLRAELVGVDPQTDIAVLSVDPEARELTEVSFGDSENIRIGDWVMAIGNPFGLGGSVSVGIVSARGRDIQSGPYDDFIQTDAAINRGNSGGPLFNMNGEVIGINTAIISPTGGSIGIGFAIPSSLAVNVVDQLREFGETRRGWLGVRIQPVTDDIAESLGMDEAAGALVAGVMDGGPVSDGTIQAGDVILEFDGRTIVNMRDLPRIVADSPIGEEVEVRIMRAGEEQTVTVTLGRLEDSQDQEMAAVEGDDDEVLEENGEAVDSATVLGLTVAALSDEARQNYGIDESVSGVVITEVEAGSTAEERGIEPGEVITEIAQQAVSEPQDVVERIQTLREQGRRNALLMLSTGSGELRFVTVLMD